jgi:hypothetical protein
MAALLATVIVCFAANAQAPQAPPADAGLPDLPELPGVPVVPEQGRAAPTAPLANAGDLEPRLGGFSRVEPGRHPVEFQGSGILGPHNYDEHGRWLDFGIIVQGEYLQNSPSSGQSTEYLFFRRLRPIVMGGLDNDWQAILMVDFGAGQNGNNYQTAIRWANFQYIGIEQSHLTFGSFKPWFSRELLTIGPHLQTIERSPVGNTNYGNPDYMIGAAWDQMLPDRKMVYYMSAGLEDHAQGVTQMQMKSPAYAPTNANQGWLITARVDYYLIGEMPYDSRPLHTPAPIAYNRGDFHTDGWRAIVSAGAYGWWNDGNSNPYTVNGTSTSTTNADLDKAYGLEVSGGVRGYGFSADVEYQYVRGDLLVSSFTGGLYANGHTDLNKFSVTGGYMLPLDVELVAAWSAVDATGFKRALTETTLGVNWYVKKYAVRFSANYSFVNNNEGTPGNNVGVARALAQFVW